MIIDYECPLCSFIFRVTKKYIHFKCPSCDVVVQAVEYVDRPPAGTFDPATSKNWKDS